MSKIGEFIQEADQTPASRIDAAARKRRVYAATILECTQLSFRLVTMAGIAKRARVSTASLYREFTSREALIEQATTFAAPFILNDFPTEIADGDPKQRLISLLVGYGNSFQDVYANWFYRVLVSGETGDNPAFAESVAAARKSIEAFWAAELDALQAKNVLRAHDSVAMVNLLLGAVQRRTLLALLLFGPDDVAEPSLEVAATSAVEWLFDLYGSPTSRSTPPPSPPWQFQAPPLGKSFVQVQVEQDLALPHDRVDTENRYQKILAAAVLECSEVGFHKASLAHIARRAGVSTSTLYGHFGDKNDMWLKSFRYIVVILTRSVTTPPSIDDPRVRIAAFLVNHGGAYLDPFLAWSYRVYASYGREVGGEEVSQMGRISRTMTEEFWRSQLHLLEVQGYLKPNDHTQTLNILLGGVERRTLLDFLVMGVDYVSYEGLVEAATFATNTLFARLGTDKFKAEFG
jgi:AcrR family transcriptional regulator